MKHTRDCESQLRKQGHSREEAQRMCSEREGSKTFEKKDDRKSEKSSDDLKEDIG